MLDYLQTLSDLSAFALVALVSGGLALVWARLRWAVLTGLLALTTPLAAAWLLYWLPVYRGADASEYAPWVLLGIVPLFSAGICVSALVTLLVRQRKQFLAVAFLALLLAVVVGAPRENDRGFADFTFSPDGRNVLAMFGDTKSSLLYTIALDTGRATRFTSATGDFEGWSSFSPDGKHVAYSAGKSLEESRIIIANSDDSGAHPITTTTDGSDYGLSVRATHPLFATDTRIVFVKSGYFGSYSPTTHTKSYKWTFDLIDLSTGNVSPLTDQDFKPSSQAAVSPDGRYLIYVADEGGGEELQIHPVEDRSKQKRVIRPKIMQPKDSLNDPTFDPDGKGIFFLAATTGKDGAYDFDIYRLDLATEKVEKLTTANGYIYCLRVSPDGKRAIFVRDVSRLSVKRSDVILFDLVDRRETILKVKGID